MFKIVNVRISANSCHKMFILFTCRIFSHAADYSTSFDVGRVLHYRGPRIRCVSWFQVTRIVFCIADLIQPVTYGRS